MSFPKVVAFDTDWTLWQNETQTNIWGQGRQSTRRPILEDNMERIDRQTIRDVTDHGVWIRVYGDVSKIINHILSNGAQLAIVAYTNKALSDRALYYFNTINPADNKEWSIIHLVKYDEVVSEPKTFPFRRIAGWAQCDPLDILHFDDEALNNAVRIETAVTFKWCMRDRGLTWGRYQEAINHWKRVQDIRIHSNPNPAPERRIIGFSGLSNAWINRVNVEREGIVDPAFPYRWGYALYVTDDIEVAQFYVRWEEQEGRDAFVNQVWVNDYAKWAALNKIWIRQYADSLGFPQMNNMGWRAEPELSGQNQERRDNRIEELWGVKAPYVMFSRHHWMEGMPLPKGEWTSEMMIYTQTHRALVSVVTMTNEQVNEQIKQNRQPWPFHHQIANWNITLPKETRDEEPHFYADAR